MRTLLSFHASSQMKNTRLAAMPGAGQRQYACSAAALRVPFADALQALLRWQPGQATTGSSLLQWPGSFAKRVQQLKG